MPHETEYLEGTYSPVYSRHWIVVLLLLIFLAHPLAALSSDEHVDATDSASLNDLEQIVASGALRVLHHTGSDKKSRVSEIESAMLAGFAESLQLDLQWVEVDDKWNLLPRLLEGAGDVIVGEGMSLLAGMSGPTEFTVPWMTSRQLIVARSDTTQINSPADLAYRQIAIKQSSAAWPILEEMARKQPAMKLFAVPESLSQDEILQRVSTGQYDVTALDSQFLIGYLPHHPELSAVYGLAEGEARAWAVRASAENLQKTLNQFLYKNHLSLSVDNIHLDDLPEMRARRSLRVITYQDPAHYYFSDGRFHGFEYDLISRYAEAEGMRVDVVLANSHDEMQSLLLRGEGDIIAASIPAKSIDRHDIAVSESYNYSMPVIVGREADKAITDIRDLEGRRITLPASSPFRKKLERIKARGIDFEIAEADSTISVNGVLSMVSAGAFDLTLLDNQQLKPEVIGKYQLNAHFPLGEPVPNVWAVRAENSRLLVSVNDFLKATYRNKFYNILYAKYFERKNNDIADVSLLPQADKLSPYDEIVRQYAEDYSFDWRLIVAQMYQESQFNPAAVSYAGAEGLMQLMPATARSVGADNLSDPEMNIASGVKYLSQLRDRFEKELLLEDRSWLTLASYNAGYGRINQARKLAEEMGLDKNRWFDNVEKAMLVMAKPVERDGEEVRNCRCGQTVAYVREIRTLYNNYVRLTQNTSIASTGIISFSPYDI